MKTYYTEAPVPVPSLRTWFSLLFYKDKRVAGHSGSHLPCQHMGARQKNYEADLEMRVTGPVSKQNKQTKRFDLSLN